jgi:hypothetical protein
LNSYFAPFGGQKAVDAARTQAGEIFFTEGNKHWRSATVRRLARTVRAVEMNAVRHEQYAASTRPYWFEPISLRARVQQSSATAVLGESLEPPCDLIPIKRRIGPNATVPLARQAVIALSEVALGAIPWARVGSGKLEVEWSEPVDNPARRDVNLRLTNTRLM